MPPMSTERMPQMKNRLRMRRSSPDSDGFLHSSCTCTAVADVTASQPSLCKSEQANLFVVLTRMSVHSASPHLQFLNSNRVPQLASTQAMVWRKGKIRDQQQQCNEVQDVAPAQPKRYCELNILLIQRNQGGILVTWAPMYTSCGMKRFCHRVSSSGGSTPVISDLNLDVEAQKIFSANCARWQSAFVMFVTAPACTIVSIAHRNQTHHDIMCTSYMRCLHAKDCIQEFSALCPACCCCP